MTWSTTAKQLPIGFIWRKRMGFQQSEVARAESCIGVSHIGCLDIRRLKDAHAGTSSSGDLTTLTRGVQASICGKQEPAEASYERITLASKQITVRPARYTFPHREAWPAQSLPLRNGTHLVQLVVGLLVHELAVVLQDLNPAFGPKACQKKPHTSAWAALYNAAERWPRRAANHHPIWYRHLFTAYSDPPLALSTSRAAFAKSIDCLSCQMPPRYSTKTN
jgi:hypothetical protein